MIEFRRSSVAVFLFTSFLLSTMVGCSSLFYYPNRDRVYLQPSLIGYQEQEHWIGEDPKIHAWIFEPRATPAKGTVVHFHGNAQNLTSHYLQLIWMTDHGYRLVAFDYPGYGRSPGEPSPRDNLESGIQVLQWVVAKYPETPLVIVGQSLGGNIALRALEEVKKRKDLSQSLGPRIRAAVIDSSFLSYRAIAREKLSKSWITWWAQPLTYVLLSDRWAPSDLSVLNKVDKLVIHTEGDELVEHRFGKEIFETLPEPKEFWSLPMGGHLVAFRKEGLSQRERLLDWLGQRISSGTN